MGGQYHPDDELIKQYDEAIAKLTWLIDIIFNTFWCYF